MSSYLFVAWKHDLANEPIELYSELDDARYETRKVEVFRDGRLGFADTARATGSTRLSIEALPSEADIGADAQFEPKQITRDEFEQIWAQAVSVRTH